MGLRLSGLGAAVVALACASSASAAVVIGGSVGGDTIFAQWENPVFIGDLIDGATGTVYQGHPQDWTSTAVYDLGGSLPANSVTLTWGANPGATSPPPAFSSLTFTGDVIPDDGSKGSTPFNLGSIAYSNGTSQNGTGIFGATLVFYARSGANNIPIGSDFVALSATLNDGTDAQNADYLNFQGTNASFNVYEGATATGQLQGVIVGDPHTHVLSVTLDPGQGANGFIGNNVPGAVPEPASWAMMLIGLGGLGGMIRVRRRASAAA